MRFKQFFFFAALLAMTAACADQLEVNPNFNPETKEVTTNLVLNFSLPNGPQTKQNGTAVQAGGGNFWGLRDAVLLSYKLQNPNRILVSDSTATKIDSLGMLATAGSLDLDNSHRIIELSLPIQTNNLLFYARAIAPTTAYGADPNTSTATQEADYGLYDCFGHLDMYRMSSLTGGYDIQLGKRLVAKDEFYAVEQLLAGILSVIMNTSVRNSNHQPLSSSVYTIAVAVDEYPEFYWQDYANPEQKSPVELTHSLYPLEKKLADAFKQMTSIKTTQGELRAASAEALERTIQDLWTVVNEVRCATPTSKAEAVAKYMASLINSRISRFFTGNVSDEGEPVTGTKFKEDIHAAEGLITVLQNSYNDEWIRPSKGNTIYWPVNFNDIPSSTSSVRQFPFNYNLPRGGTHMAYSESDSCFYYPRSFNTSGMGGAAGAEDGAFNAESYYYPPEILYFGNSNIATSTSDKKPSDFPNGIGTGANNWNENYNWASKGWTATDVSSATRSVAMVKDIRYGNALLETKVQYGASVLYDNNHAVQNALHGGTLPSTVEPDKEISVTSTSFKLTGVIIGGQYKRVGWDFLPDTSAKQGFIYDRAVPTSAQSIPSTVGTPSSPNYTLVFDNCVGAYPTTGSNHVYQPHNVQNKVYVALEFRNDTGIDFYGNYNMIRNGGYFYLIGELDPTNYDITTNLVWPANYVVPPYNLDGTSNHVERVFMQTFMTSATFTLGRNSLKYAYLTVPDLRAGSMNLGLSVNLKWEQGMVFTTVLGDPSANN